MSNLYCGIDLSLRSTAIVVLDDKYNVIDYKVITSDAKQYKDEALLLYNSRSIVDFISKVCLKEEYNKTTIYHGISNIAIERLSYNSTSGNKDVISANSWILRTKLYEIYPTIKPVIVSVKEWRSSVISVLEQKLINDTYPVTRAKKGYKLTKEETKINNKHKNDIKKETKKLTVSKLPSNVKLLLDNYIKNDNLNKDAIYDLADAYFICKYLIDNKSNK